MEFRINESPKEFNIKEFNVEFSHKKGWLPLAHFKFVFDSDIRVVRAQSTLDRSKYWLSSHAREEEAARRKFIERFGVSPMRILFLTVVQRFGSKKKGLKWARVRGTSEPGEKFYESLCKTGFFQKLRESVFVVPQSVVKKAKALGGLEKASKGRIKALMGRQPRKAVRQKGNRKPPATRKPKRHKLR